MIRDPCLLMVLHLAGEGVIGGHEPCNIIGERIMHVLWIVRRMNGEITADAFQALHVAHGSPSSSSSSSISSGSSSSSHSTIKHLLLPAIPMQPRHDEPKHRIAFRTNFHLDPRIVGPAWATVFRCAFDFMELRLAVRRHDAEVWRIPRFGREA